jgi:hypothetical protein
VSTATLFGSRVRAGTLETLASTSKPLTAYRVGAQPIQVLSILKSLGPEVVRHSPEGWLLANDDLRRFLRGELARLEVARRAEKDKLLTGLGMVTRHSHGHR